MVCIFLFVLWIESRKKLLPFRVKWNLPICIWGDWNSCERGRMGKSISAQFFFTTHLASRNYLIKNVSAQRICVRDGRVSSASLFITRDSFAYFCIKQIGVFFWANLIPVKWICNENDVIFCVFSAFRYVQNMRNWMAQQRAIERFWCQSVAAMIVEYEFALLCPDCWRVFVRLLPPVGYGKGC